MSAKPEQKRWLLILRSVRDDERAELADVKRMLKAFVRMYKMRLEKIVELRPKGKDGPIDESIQRFGP